ncbi:kinase-like domain-containing protein [Tricharina praecox]|uniref:kinase-like domain-containing protein n=1 Tax=Tricharina praecox TaxID=43433 RepID=UPI00221FADD1|nr:kinase-like domain-containing protein [Tricharina praecox]KAI5844325.1 kinase-like domain-containing protein [Tricharina praecox]
MHEPQPDAIPKPQADAMPDPQPDAKDCRSTLIKKKLDDKRKAMLTQAGHVKSVPRYEPIFFPEDLIKDVLSRKTVKWLLECDCSWCEKHTKYLSPQIHGEKRTDYLGCIMADALKLYALLVFIEHPAIIGGFVSKGKYDNILNDKLTPDNLKETHLTGIVSATRQRTSEMEDLLDSFLKKKHWFSPQFFKGPWFEELDSEKVLPFINITYIGEGAFGKVYSFQIYPAYKGPEYGDSTKFAMKEVYAPTNTCGANSATDNPEVDKVNSEAKNLLKIRNELGDEEHIIKVLKIFRHGENICFIFPLAIGNLAKLMEEPWMHLSIPGHPICQHSIWNEVLGMMMALGRFHNPPNKNSWSGVHADIKPTNILVFEDGRLVITDFGQSSIMQKRSSGGTRRVNQTPGEQTYRPPENSGDTDMGLEYDYWAIGCVLLEILVFVVTGTQGIRELLEARGRRTYRTDYYYQVEDDKRFLHPAVEEIMTRLEEGMKDRRLDSGFTDAVVGIVKSMLKVDPKKRLDVVTAARRLKYNLKYWRRRASEVNPVSSCGGSFTILNVSDAASETASSEESTTTTVDAESEINTSRIDDNESPSISQSPGDTLGSSSHPEHPPSNRGGEIAAGSSDGTSSSSISRRLRTIPQPIPASAGEPRRQTPDLISVDTRSLRDIPVQQLPPTFARTRPASSPRAPSQSSSSSSLPHPIAERTSGQSISTSISSSVEKPRPSIDGPKLYESDGEINWHRDESDLDGNPRESYRHKVCVMAGMAHGGQPKIKMLDSGGAMYRDFLLGSNPVIFPIYAFKRPQDGENREYLLKVNHVSFEFPVEKAVYHLQQVLTEQKIHVRLVMWHGPRRWRTHSADHKT